MGLQKLVVRVDAGGDYDCSSCEVVRCLEYESPEAWLAGFEQELDKVIAAWEQYRVLQEDWVARRPKVSPGRKGRVAAEEAFRIWQEMSPDPANIKFDAFEFTGSTWYLDNHYARHDRGNYGAIKAGTKFLPEVYELHEWFESNRTY